MKQVNVYTYSTIKSPRILNGTVGYVLEYVTEKGGVTRAAKKHVKMTKNQSHLHVLKMALNRINTKCELHLYIESEFVAAGFEQGWIEEWKKNNWKTKKNEPVKNEAEWKELDALVQKHGHELVFHVKEDHSYRQRFKDNLEKEKKRAHGKNE